MKVEDANLPRQSSAPLSPSLRTGPHTLVLGPSSCKAIFITSSSAFRDPAIIQGRCYLYAQQPVPLMLFLPTGLSARSFHVFPYSGELFSLQLDVNTDDQRYFPGNHHRGIYEQEKGAFPFFFRYVVATTKVITLQCELHHLRARRVSNRYRMPPNPSHVLGHALEPACNPPICTVRL